MNRFPVVPAALALLLFFGAVPAHAQDEIRSERVQFKKGAASAVIKGRLKGYASVDYLVRAGAGQTIAVSLKPVASDSPSPLTSSRQGDVTTVTFDTGERYEIPDALVSGG